MGRRRRPHGCGSCGATRSLARADAGGQNQRSGSSQPGMRLTGQRTRRREKLGHDGGNSKSGETVKNIPLKDGLRRGCPIRFIRKPAIGQPAIHKPMGYGLAASPGAYHKRTSPTQQPGTTWCGGRNQRPKPPPPPRRQPPPLLKPLRPGRWAIMSTLVRMGSGCAPE